MTTLVATSVVRGSRQGESHGGVYLVDLERQRVTQPVDWNTANIDWRGRGWDRGLRGIACDGERVFIAASDELFVYDADFCCIASFRSPYLKHCHEISRFERRLYLASTGFDAILGFDLDRNTFRYGLHIARRLNGFNAQPFDPAGNNGPPPGNTLHLNSVHCHAGGMYIAGLRTAAMLQFDGRRIRVVCSLPHGTHNARPFRDGVLFNDSQQDALRFVSPTAQQAFAVPRYDEALLTHTDLDDSRIARQAFARGLCVLDDGRIAGGSSPSTIALYDLDAARMSMTVTLSMDVRNAVHGLEVWPFAVT
ncbi:MAG TPA: hypothetical protein VFE85_00260 [Woeseiaceae bacterium]|nr:hypothetical protein [Woeseiaceae bacterium]